MEEKSEIQAGESAGSSFRPFYEWIPDRFAIPLIVKVLLSISLGCLYLAPRYKVVKDEILIDWGWLLGLIIVAGMICLYYATHVFRAMMPQLNLLLRTQDSAVIDRAYFHKVRYYLSNKMFIRFGIIFAVANCGVGLALMEDNEGPLEIATTFLGYFLAGFVCGMAVCGIIGVVVTLTEYLDHEPKVDYTNPDRCGGFLFFGDALIKFAGVTLLVGVLISVYILKALWDPEDLPSPLAQAIMWLWIALPFSLSMLILLAPSSRANRALMNHRIEQEVKLGLAFDKSRDALLQAGVAADRREELRHEIDYYGDLRTQLHQMRVWPFNTQSNIKFILLLVSNAFVAIQSVQGLISSGDTLLSGLADTITAIIP